MKNIKPMIKILMILCIFGISTGAVFPIYAGYFVNWIPGKRIPFVIGCLIAGAVVGMFGFLVTLYILRKINNEYKGIMSEKLGMSHLRTNINERDMLISMKSEFEELLNQFVLMKRNEEARLKELSITDCLTNLYNHRHFYETFQRKIDNGSKEMHLLFCDIDHFKRINDYYGHLIGDMILKDVAHELKSIVNDSNIFRYGGEEFIVLVEDVSIEYAFSLAEKIRNKVSCINPLNKSNDVEKVTISIGIASFPEHSFNLIDLIDKADKAMYQAKSQGRNCCMIYNDLLSSAICL